MSPWPNRYKKCQMFSSQVFAVQTPMCDMMREIDKERNLCKAQIENKTTGMSFIYVCVTRLLCPIWKWVVSSDTVNSFYVIFRRSKKSTAADALFQFPVDEA